MSRYYKALKANCNRYSKCYKKLSGLFMQIYDSEIDNEITYISHRYADGEYKSLDKCIEVFKNRRNNDSK